MSPEMEARVFELYDLIGPERLRQLAVYAVAASRGWVTLNELTQSDYTWTGMLEDVHTVVFDALLEDRALVEACFFEKAEYRETLERASLRAERHALYWWLYDYAPEEPQRVELYLQLRGPGTSVDVLEALRKTREEWRSRSGS